jgi:tetratricopeptide (TPR) repeat protein
MRALVAACTAGFVSASAMIAPLHADPVDIGHAKQLYDEANDAMAAGKFDDAAAYYEAAYKITGDAVLFFKIATADEKAGKCAAAIELYKRYLAEASPQPQYVELTNERIAACTHAAGSDSGSGSASPTPTPTATASETGSGSATTTTTDLGSGSDSGSGLGSAIEPADTGSIRRDDTPWLFVGGALAFVTLGAVLAYSANSTESDVRDLYQGVDNQPVVYDTTTAQRYQSLVSEGKRYEYLSWTSFGVGVALGAVAGWLFWQDYKERRVIVAPMAGPQGAGAMATLRF